MPKKDEQEQTKTGPASVPNMKLETDVEIERSFRDEELAPLDKITLEMGKVAVGGSVVALRKLASDLMPTDKAKAREFADQLQRLRLAGEAVAQSGQEAYSRIVNG